MIDQPSTDIIPFLKTLAGNLQPLAELKNIRFEIYTTENEIRLDQAEEDLNTGFKKLIASIIDYMPENNTVYLSAEIIEKAGIRYVSIKIRNTGINLKIVAGITRASSLPVTLFSSAENETTFEVCYILAFALTKPEVKNASVINYTSFVNGIRSQFHWLNNPMVRLLESKPKEAAFLTTVNNCILKYIEDDQFDANALSQALAISRAQLLRRLKSLTGNSPGFYIKTMRLEKAKELLETSDLSVSETAFKTGFGTPSNFTKVFAEKYGMTPSQFRRLNPNATN